MPHTLSGQQQPVMNMVAKSVEGHLTDSDEVFLTNRR
jgi:hypothetical protein